MSGSPLRSLSPAALIIGIVMGICACGSPSRSAHPDSDYADLFAPGIREPANDLERAVLAKLETMHAGEPTKIAGSSVVASKAYYAASGRRCRSVTIPGSGAVLACRVNRAWAFVPEALPDWEPPQ